MTKGGWIGGRLVSEAFVAPNFFRERERESEPCIEEGVATRFGRDGRAAHPQESRPTGEDSSRWYVNAEEEDT